MTDVTGFKGGQWDESLTHKQSVSLSECVIWAEEGPGSKRVNTGVIVGPDGAGHCVVPARKTKADQVCR